MERSVFEIYRLGRTKRCFPRVLWPLQFLYPTGRLSVLEPFACSFSTLSVRAIRLPYFLIFPNCPLMCAPAPLTRRSRPAIPSAGRVFATLKVPVVLIFPAYYRSSAPTCTRNCSTMRLNASSVSLSFKVRSLLEKAKLNVTLFLPAGKCSP